MGRGFAHRHDVIDADTLLAADPEGTAEAFALELFFIAEHEIDFAHLGKALGIDLRGAAGDDDARVRIVASGLADRLARLTCRFRRHRASIEDDRILEAAFVDLGAHDFRLIDIEPAAEGDDARFAHASTVRWEGNTPSNS